MRTSAALAALLLTSFPAFADEKTIEVPAAPGALHGTLLQAGPNRPAILFLSGSGPTDRDGNSVLGIRANSYKLLADGLAAKGISSLRYDKRGVGASRDALTAESDLRIQTYVSDAAAMAAELRKQAGASCVWLLGHSEGALVAELAAQKRTDICGLVLVSAMGRKFGEVVRAQLDANPANPPGLRQEASRLLAELEAGHQAKDVPPALSTLLRPSVQPYLISELSLDPAALVGAESIPVLIVQGETDLQTSVTDAKLLAAARPDAELAILPGVNHLLKAAPADRAANLATYGNPDLPLASGVVDTIADFVHQHSK